MLYIYLEEINTSYYILKQVVLVLNNKFHNLKAFFYIKNNFQILQSQTHSDYII